MSLNPTFPDALQLFLLILSISSKSTRRSDFPGKPAWSINLFHLRLKRKNPIRRRGGLTFTKKNNFSLEYFDSCSPCFPSRLEIEFAHDVRPIFVHLMIILVLRLK